ncbi:MAG: hypothetical protein KKG04_03530 [Candidatus Thermoplasmatota archaeon]|nr:hypothetical protein [Candidatus Thermoplasmatota archaeon]
MTTHDDYLEINGTSYYLNTSLNNSYTNLSRPIEWWNETTNQTEIVGWEPRPYFYIKEDTSSNEVKSLYLIWDDDLDYRVTVKTRNGQYNAPVTLFIKIGTLAAGQEKHTKLLWYDANQTTYYFNDYDESEEWNTNPSHMVDCNTSTYATTMTNNDVEWCTGSNASAVNSSVISKVELRAYGKYIGGISSIEIQPKFNGEVDGDIYTFNPSTSPGWSSWFDITNDASGPEEWSWNDIISLDCRIHSDMNLLFQSTVFCSKIELRVTYTVNNAPTIFNPNPADGSSGITLPPVLSINLSDIDDDNMNITWLSNSSGSWQVFGTNISVGTGICRQTFSNATENGKWWYWKVNVTDGVNYIESNTYGFYTGNQSKIQNTGNTSFKGYLLIQVQFYNQTSGNWTIADNTINETTPRTMNTTGGLNAGSVLGLDTIFNGNVYTGDLSSFGSGTYRIYAALRDPEGNVLVCNDEIKLEATYEFTITYS